MLNSPSNFNPISALNWDSTGLGVLPGSKLKFKINGEFGTLELVDDQTDSISTFTNSPIPSNVQLTSQTTKQSQSKSNHSNATNNQQMNQQNDNQQENKVMSERMKICPKCGKSKYRSTFYRKGKFCSQECSLMAKGKKLKKKKKRTRRSSQQDQSPQITTVKSLTNSSSTRNQSSNIPSSNTNQLIDVSVVQMGKSVLKKTVQENNQPKNVPKKVINKKADNMQVTVVHSNHEQQMNYVVRVNDKVMKDTTKTKINNKNVMRDASNKGGRKVKQKDVKSNKRGRQTKSNHSESSNAGSRSQSIDCDGDSNHLSLESIHSYSEQDLVRQLSSFVNTLNPTEIIAEWNSDRVSDFVSILPECLEYAHKFKDENIDGESFLLLSQNDLINILDIKLYSALKIYDVICQIRKNLLKLV